MYEVARRLTTAGPRIEFSEAKPPMIAPEGVTANPTEILRKATELPLWRLFLVESELFVGVFDAYIGDVTVLLLHYGRGHAGLSYRA